MPDASKMRRLGRLGAARTNALYDRRELTAAARAAMARKFEDMVDPGRELPPDERAELVRAARSEYFRRISALGVAARRLKAEKRKARKEAARARQAAARAEARS